MKALTYVSGLFTPEIGTYRAAAKDARELGSAGKYRPDIDGLRAIAILPVVLFHYGIAPFTGGFVGVDIFFVISGFLITTLIHDEIQAGHFSIVRFYERRVRRLFPALFAMLACTAAASFALLLPEDLKSYGISLGAATVFASNFEFLREVGYFDAAAKVKPLLHTWSLAVEEQYYLAFPLLLILLGRRPRRQLVAIVCLLAVFSFVLGVWTIHRNPAVAFYFSPARAWELFLGAALALAKPAAPKSRGLADILGFAGLVLVVTSILQFSSESRFPGPNALFACCGALLLIYAGSVPRSTIGRLLAMPPLVSVGRISYSLYLWHWPIFVFASYYAFAPLAWWQKAVLIAVSFFLAGLSYFFVERPFRGPHSKIDRSTVFRMSAAAMACTIAFALVAVGFRGLPGRFSSEIVRLLPATALQKAGRCEGAIVPGFPASVFCMLGHDAKATPSFLLWGDSLASALSPAIEQVVDRQHRTGYFVEQNGCPPLMDVTRSDTRGCPDFNRAALSLAVRPEVKEVIFVSRWALNAEGTRVGDESGPRVSLNFGNVAAAPADNNHQVFERALDSTIKMLRARGKTVVLVHSSPEIGLSVPQAMAKARILGSSFDPSPTRAEYFSRQAFIFSVFERIKARYGVTIVRPDTVLCASGACEVQVGGHLLYRDDHHLSRFGALRLVDILSKAI